MRISVGSFMAVLLLAASLSPAAAAAVQGVYANRNGIFTFDFQPDGKVRFSGVGGGGLLDYAIEGDTVIVQTPAGPQRLTILDEDTLRLPDLGEVRRDRDFACSDDSGPIGTMILGHDGNVLLRAPDGTDAPEPLGTYAEDAASVTVQQDDGSNVFTREGRDLRADKVVCKRL